MFGLEQSWDVVALDLQLLLHYSPFNWFLPKHSALAFWGLWLIAHICLQIGASNARVAWRAGGDRETGRRSQEEKERGGKSTNSHFILNGAKKIDDFGEEHCSDVMVWWSCVSSTQTPKSARQVSVTSQNGGAVFVLCFQTESSVEKCQWFPACLKLLKF